MIRERLRAWLMKGAPAPIAPLEVNHEQAPTEEFALVHYRSQKLDGPFEGVTYVTKQPRQAWKDVLQAAQAEIEKAHDAKSPVMIIYFAKL